MWWEEAVLWNDWKGFNTTGNKKIKEQTELKHLSIGRLK